VQKEADAKGRELLPREIAGLFEDAYHLKRNPRFTLIDYNITAVRAEAARDHTSVGQPPQDTKIESHTQAPVQNTSSNKRQFAGVIAIDGVQHPLIGVGTGAISSLANALHSLGIDLDVADYKEHALASGKDVKAATYIECMVSGNPHEKVWGVGIHEDVVQASLIALLSAASGFLTSRVSTPKPFRPKHMREFSASEMKALEQLNLGSTSPLRESMTPTRGTMGSGLNGSPLSARADRVDISKLEQEAWKEEEKVNGMNGA